ncbi:MAG TPA: hypothetical protein VNA04_04355 [Thermoanaerobaculia bacterium]|nr:hypothetical protein [Thermoanaerobaculia bacterium]
MDLTDEEVRRFVDACSDAGNEAAREAMTAAGASFATGVLARLLIASDEERERLEALIRQAIRT